MRRQTVKRSTFQGLWLYLSSSFMSRACASQPPSLNNKRTTNKSIEIARTTCDGTAIVTPCDEQISTSQAPANTTPKKIDATSPMITYGRLVTKGGNPSFS